MSTNALTKISLTPRTKNVLEGVAVPQNVENGVMSTVTEIANEEVIIGSAAEDAQVEVIDNDDDFSISTLCEDNLIIDIDADKLAEMMRDLNF